MKTIKSHTSVKQSRKLAEILPLESADMHYNNASIKGKNYVDAYRAELMDYNAAQKVLSKLVNPFLEVIPCWSLAALLSVLPFHLIVNNQRYAFSMHKGLNKDGETYMLEYNVFNTDVCLCSTEYYNNPVDACYEMILKLKELNLK